MTREEMKLKIEEEMSPERFIHSLNVMNTAHKLAKRYQEDTEKAAIAGLLHDIARDIKREEIFSLCKEYGIQIDEVSKMQPELLHAPIGAAFANKYYGITDEEILKAISYHTTGHQDMSMLEKIVFIADYIEPNRTFPGIIEIREIVNVDINKAIMLSLEKTIKFILAKGSLIHLDTIKARNSIVINDLQNPLKNQIKNPIKKYKNKY